LSSRAALSAAFYFFVFIHESQPDYLPYISVVIPVFNEEENLAELGERLVRTLSGLSRPFELIFVDDGSTDGSWELLSRLHRRHPEQVKAIQFHRNFGQHQAVFAGLAAARGEIMVTLDADLQNPPEEIPKLIGQPRHVLGHRGAPQGLRLYAQGLPPGGGGQHQPVSGILQLHSGLGQPLCPAGDGNPRGPRPPPAG